MPPHLGLYDLYMKANIRCKRLSDQIVLLKAQIVELQKQLKEKEDA